MFLLEVQPFLFILARVTAFLVIVPGFSHRSLPGTVKVALSLVLSFTVHVSLPGVAGQAHTLLFILAVMREAVIGLAMGYAGKLVFTAVEMAGQLIDFQVGYSMGAIYDPSSGATSSYYGRLFYWMSILVFFMLDLHHGMVLSLMDSFRVAPIGRIGLEGLNLSGMLYLFSHAFRIAFSIAAPMLVVLLVTDIVMGLVSRTVPQINVFMLGMPLKSLIGMVMFLLLASVFMGYAGSTLALMGGYVEKTFEMFR